MLWRYIPLLLSVILFAACARPASHGWEMVGVASLEETIRASVPQEFYVCNCSGAAVPETPSCGVEKFTSYGGQIGTNIGAGISISASALAEIGEVETWSHSVHLQPPTEPGYVTQYQVVYQRSVQQGQGLFRPDNSSDSTEPIVAPFERERMCRVAYWVVDQIACEEAHSRNVSCARPSELAGETISIPSPEISESDGTQDGGATVPVPTVPPPPPTPMAYFNPHLTHLGQPTTGTGVSSWSPDGRYAIISGQNGVLNVWDVGYNRVAHFLAYNEEAILEKLSWSPDGRYWAGGDRAGYVSVWDARNGLIVKQWKAHSAPITSLAWSPDNLYLATGGANRTTYIWRIDTGEKVRELRDHSAAVNSIVWSPEGTHLVSSSFDANLRIWDWMADVSSQQINTAHRSGIPVLAWSPDGLWLLSGDNDGQIGLWRWQENQLQLQGLRSVDQYRILSLAWSHDSRLIAFSSLGQRTQVKTIDFNDVGDALQRISVYSSAFSSENGQLLVGDEQGNLYKWLFDD